MSLRLHRSDGPLERHEVKMIFAGVVQDGAIDFDPGVRFEAIAFFSSADADVRRDPAAPQQPPEHE
jgi:hypothetical protein